MKSEALIVTVKVAVAVWLAESATWTPKVAVPATSVAVVPESTPALLRLKPTDCRLFAPVAPEVTVQV
jgi:hypothetical protein